MKLLTTVLAALALLVALTDGSPADPSGLDEPIAKRKVDNPLGTSKFGCSNSVCWHWLATSRIGRPSGALCGGCFGSRVPAPPGGSKLGCGSLCWHWTKTSRHAGPRGVICGRCIKDKANAVLQRMMGRPRDRRR
jgi:hypothetical protein